MSNKSLSKTNYSLRKNIIHNISLSNENKNLHRRIHQKCSIYSISKWDEQYKKSQEYKKNLCQYPCIDFCDISTFPKKKANKLRSEKEGNMFNEIKFRDLIKL